MSSSAKPSEIMVIPKSEIKRLSAVQIMKDELVLLGSKTSASCKYSIMIRVIE